MAADRYRFAHAMPGHAPYHAARYQPGSIGEVARVISRLRPGAQVAEITMPAGGQYLAVVIAPEPPRSWPQCLLVPPGAWVLAYPPHHSAFWMPDRDFRRDYEPVTG